MAKRFIPIWFFIGSLLLLYGILILGSGIYQAFAPAAQSTVLSELHAGIWWGALLIILGGAYCYGFWPGRQKDH